jgi:hypothetical protein
MAGTETSVSMRSSSMACRKAPTSKAGMITAVPPTCTASSSWLLQPVTWNKGTEIRVRRPSAVTESVLRHVSALERKFSWLVTAPLGNPVVPLV